MNKIEDGIDWEFENSELNKKLCQVLIPSVYHLIREKNFDEAINTINYFYSSNRHQDKKGSLKNACNLWLAQILERKGEYSKALEIYEGLAAKMKPNYNLYITRQTNVVKVLQHLKEYEKAAEKVEETIENQVNGDLFDVLLLLEYYVDILDASQKKFPVKYSSLIETTIKTLSLNLLDIDLSNTTHLSKVVREISELNRSANKRYSNLAIELQKTEDDLLAISILKKYISEESFEFYRNLAIEDLKELE